MVPIAEKHVFRSYNTFDDSWKHLKSALKVQQNQEECQMQPAPPPPLTCFADEQCPDESWIDVPDRVHLRRVWVGEALGVAAGGTIFGADIPDVLVVSSRIHGIIVLLRTCCGVIIPGSWWANTQSEALIFLPTEWLKVGIWVSQVCVDFEVKVGKVSRHFLDTTYPDHTHVFTRTARSGHVPMSSVNGINPKKPLSAQSSHVPDMRNDSVSVRRR